jgi:hypothetical protein
LLDGRRCLFSRGRYFLTCARSHIINVRDNWFDAPASSFFKASISDGAEPDAHIDILPQHHLLYVSIPKCASTTIKAVLSALNGKALVLPDELHTRRLTGLRSPSQIGLSAFHQLATNASSLRFAFVRNPYARLVSAWADKFQNKPLVAGDPFVDLYLERRASVNRLLPYGAGQTLPFERFVEFATATADHRVDAHWHLQSDLINIPGIELNFIGRVENFQCEFTTVLDHLGADDRLRRLVDVHFNSSSHRPWQYYYSSHLANRVYRAYERDFDRFEYSRAHQ